MSRVSRRIFVSATLKPGTLQLDAEQAHHVRNVLRMSLGDPLELFDSAGAVAAARIVACDAAHVSVAIETVTEATGNHHSIVVASAIPKGERADWLVEKLSEVGVVRWQPLLTERSVVQASGQNKLDRWRRIATEAAKQCFRTGVMQVESPVTLAAALQAHLQAGMSGILLSLAPDAAGIAAIVRQTDVVLFIGPEGGWTESEEEQMKAAALRPVRLTRTVLRVETAAVVAAGVVACNYGQSDRT